MAAALKGAQREDEGVTTDYALAVHGGAGVRPREKMEPADERVYLGALDGVVAAGEAVLRDGGSALDAVTVAVSALEDEPLFNAGRGAVFTSDGRMEMDAAIMRGLDRAAGAVAGICGPRNPIRAARAVMERTEHVLLIGEGAMSVARDAGLTIMGEEYFRTEARWASLQKTLAMRAEGALDDDPARRHGTVGAVARDREGHLAAATSTGGMTAKMPGRVGDSPIPGAGTFADDGTCAVSATGDGEIFIRWAAAHEIDARMRLAGQSLEEAATGIVMGELLENGGSGGLISVDRDGNLCLPFNCDGMYRGWSVEGGARGVAIY